MTFPIRTIPSIMRKKSWLNGAQLLERWFNAPVNSRPEDGTPDTTTIRMESFILTFERAKEEFKEILEKKIWMNDPAKREIEKLLRSTGVLKQRAGTSASFGDLARPVPSLDRDAINFRTVGGVFDSLDDLFAALGRFTFKVVIAGGVESGQTQGHRVVITEVGIYVRDSFDFNGEQRLGYWSATDVSRFPLQGYTEVTNADFRKWRAANNAGGDFLVFSDLKRLTLNPPDTFNIA